MLNYVHTDELRQVDANLYFVIRGIEQHFDNEVPSKEQVVNALMVVSSHLYELIKEAEQETRRKTEEQNASGIVAEMAAAGKEFIAQKYDITAGEIEQLFNLLGDNYSKEQAYKALTTAFYFGFSVGCKQK